MKIKVKRRTTRAGNHLGYRVTVDGKKHDVFNVITPQEATDYVLKRYYEAQKTVEEQLDAIKDTLDAYERDKQNWK